MKWSTLVVLPIVLGGCAAPSLQDLSSGSPGSVPVVPSAAEATTPVTSLGGAPAQSPSPDLPRLRTIPLPPAAEGLFPDQQGATLSLLDGDELLLLEDATEVAQELPDPETLEDNLLLSGVGENPPEDEGETVAADEIFFDFPVVENEKVHYYIDYFTGPARKTFTRWLERSGRYLPLMRQIFAEEGLPQDLAYLAMVESGFNNRAYSWAHAVGPWQFIASTGRLYGMGSDWWWDERRDFEKSTRAAARFLKDLYARFDGDWYLAVASYNAGPGKIQRAIDMYGSRDFWEISRHSYLKTETKHYVPKLLAVLLIAKEPEKYGFTELAYQEPLVFETVTLPTATDLEIVARYCETDYETIKDLNPELKRWCTPPQVRNYDLRIPAGKKEQFEQQYSLLPERQRANYKRHEVRRGDTLSGIASRYGIRVQDIVALNHIRNPRALQVGDDLILPMRQGLSRLPLEELKDDHARSTRQVTHTVRRGDTLSGIARRYGVSEKDLRTWNRLGSRNLIRVGQELKVVQGKAPAKATTVARESAPSGNKTTYQVQAGDSLWKIGRRYGVTSHQIREWNRLSAEHVLQPGEKLVVYAQEPSRGEGGTRQIVYQVRPGDTLWDIGRRFDVATREIMDWNNLNDHTLRPGDKLTLLVRNEKKG